ncbi:PREDICTED: protein I'm not dead yet-like [Papilio polytes]|uniref:protein I'm not dead yet-like n=1 Tax=Papilio polytes TaxID=76194 RepID=UPI000676A2EE|nr:PREDICTED: protein I'm not dead yet-like [Papilio polytes]
MGGFLSWRRSTAQTPIVDVGDRFKNAGYNNFRGLIGFFPPVIILPWFFELGHHDKTVILMWVCMIWMFFWQPTSIQACGLIPLFVLPMCGVMGSVAVCHCYFNDITGLFLVGSMVHLLMNNAGVDRRIALWFLCSGNSSQFTANRLVYKASTAAFLLSAVCNKFIVTSNLIDIMTVVLTNLQGKSKSGTNFKNLKYVMNNAIQTASSIGSICITHASYATLFFRGIWSVSGPRGMEFPDIFNYLQYCCYAIPTALVMFLCNVFYHMSLIIRSTGAPFSDNDMVEVKKLLLEHKKILPPKIGTHEKLAVFFTTLLMLTFIFRWCVWLNMGWSTFRREAISPSIPGIKDATVAAIFFMALHLLPRTCGFMRFLSAKRKSQLTMKPESAILFWRFVNKHTNYGYFFLLGSGVALNIAIRDTGLDTEISAGSGKLLTDYAWCLSLFIVVFIAIFLANMMPGVASCCIFLPFVINMSVAPDAPVPWPKRVYIGALGVGVASSMTFMSPFLYTPAYFCNTTGKVPKSVMAKYSFLSVIICGIIIWLSLCYWAPIVWDPTGEGISPVIRPGGNNTSLL